MDCLHAGMSQKEREEAMSRMRRGESWVMVSTEVMARGLDFKGVRGVINFDFPTSVQSYVHRIGKLTYPSIKQILIRIIRENWTSWAGGNCDHVFRRRRRTIFEAVSF